MVLCSKVACSYFGLHFGRLDTIFFALCIVVLKIPKGESYLKTLNPCDFILSLWDFSCFFFLCVHLKMIKITIVYTVNYGGGA